MLFNDRTMCLSLYRIRVSGTYCIDCNEPTVSQSPRRQVHDKQTSVNPPKAIRTPLFPNLAYCIVPSLKGGVP